MRKFLIALLVIALCDVFGGDIAKYAGKLGNWLDRNIPKESTTANSDSGGNVPATGLGQDPAKLSPDQKKKWEDLRDAVLADARRLRYTSMNPSSVRFEMAWGMKDGWECFDFVGRNELGDLTEEEVVISPRGQSYVYKVWTIVLTPGFDGAWNKHCAGKVPFVDATHMEP